MSANVCLVSPTEQFHDLDSEFHSDTDLISKRHELVTSTHEVESASSPSDADAVQFPAELALAAAEELPAQSFLTSVDQLAKHIIDQHTQRARVTAALAAAQEYAAKHGCSIDALAPQLAPLGIDLLSIARTSQHTLKGLQDCASDDGWSLVCDSGLRLLYQHHAGSQVHSFKAAATLDSPVEYPMSLAREFDLISTWNRYMVDTVILKENGGMEVWVYCAVWLPWPFASRDMVIHAQGMDLLDSHGCIAISFEAADDDLPEGSLPLPEGAASRERIKLLPGSVVKLVPVPSKVPGRAAYKTRGESLVHVDARIPNVPNAVIQFVLRVFAPFMYHTVLKILHRNFKDPSSPLPTRITQRPELYQLIHNQVASFLAASAPTA